jgi:CsoR family transcriptional regulator, copper-sensing transcriptional repressor
MKLENEALKTRLTQRLRRAAGQVRGIESMIEEGRDCREIIQQLASVQAALQGFGRELLEEYAIECLLERESELTDRQAREQVLRDLVSMINKVNS